MVDSLRRMRSDNQQMGDLERNGPHRTDEISGQRIEDLADAQTLLGTGFRPSDEKAGPKDRLISPSGVESIPIPLVEDCAGEHEG
jgi:hypothetical protein